MKRKYYSIIFLVGLGSICSGCDSNGNLDIDFNTYNNSGGNGGGIYLNLKDTLLDTYILQPKIFKYSVFKPGTYWIYESTDSTGKIEIDQVSVSDYLHDTTKHSVWDNYNREFIQMTLTHSNHDFFIDPTSINNVQRIRTIAGKDGMAYTTCETDQNITKIPKQLNFGIMLSMPYNLGKNDICESSYLGSYEVINTQKIVLNGDTIPSIHVRTQEYARLWISPGIGITRFVTMTGADWKLTDYNVVQ